MAANRKTGCTLAGGQKTVRQSAWAGQRFVTGHCCYGTTMHGPGERMGGASAPQADHEEQDFLLERDFVFPVGPANDALPAHHHVGGKRPLPPPPVDGAREPYELLGRYSLVARGAFQCRVLANGGALGSETRVGGTTSWIARDAWHELALAIAGHRRPLPRQDRCQW